MSKLLKSRLVVIMSAIDLTDFANACDVWSYTKEAELDFESFCLEHLSCLV
ncbi:MAG: hypothetical protein V8Q76_15500 [Bacteroides intestinalis]